MLIDNEGRHQWTASEMLKQCEGLRKGPTDRVDRNAKEKNHSTFAQNSSILCACP